MKSRIHPLDDGLKQSIYNGMMERVIDELPCIYELLRCGICGCSWDQHDRYCIKHYQANARIALILEAMRLQKYKPFFRLAACNGFTGLEKTGCLG